MSVFPKKGECSFKIRCSFKLFSVNLMLKGYSPHHINKKNSLGFDLDANQEYLVAFAWVLEGWSHMYEGTSEYCKGAEIPPESAAWSQTHEYHPEEFWVTC